LINKEPDYLESFMKIYLMIFDFVTFGEKNKEILLKNQDLVELFMHKIPKAVKKNFTNIFPL